MSEDPMPDVALVSLEIRPAAGDTFFEQVELIKSTGATYDGADKSWILQLSAALMNRADGLNVLFRAAATHGTNVRVTVASEPAPP